MPEFFSRTGIRAISSAKQHRRRNDLPYGQWTCADGRRVIFNRFYEPIWHRSPGQPVSSANPAEKVPFVDERWFYVDADSEKQKIRKAESAQAAFMAG